MGRASLRFFNGLFSLCMAAILIVTMLYAGFALWDNHQIYHAAESVFDEMKEIKAKMAAQAKADEEAAAKALAEAQAAEAEADAKAAAEAAEVAAAEKEARLAGYQPYGAPFDELRAINKDVTGWVTMPGTAIDYPLLQGETNYSYINTDVYGNFALAGSIFLDSRNDNEYLDVYSLLYGHNMSQHRMFSDVNLYKDQKFFEENQQGELYLPDKKHTLQSVSCIVCPASDWARFNPERWRDMTAEDILQYVQEDALYISETGLKALQTALDADEQPRLVALSTCSDEFTDARTILLTIMDPVITEDAG